MAERVLSMNLATLRGAWGFADAVEGCAKHGITTISPWRDQIDAIGMAEARRIVAANGITVASLCRGGMFVADTTAERQAALDDNRRAIDEAAEIGAGCLVLVVGGLPPSSKNLGESRKVVAEAIAAVLPHARAARVTLAIEPLHPMYAADRACINTIDQGLDLCEQLGDGVGLMIDAYHTWWDPNLASAIARAGRLGRILGHHISDWLVPTTDMLLDRGMMGDGVIDFRAFRAMIEQAGYHGPQEVEIFSRDNWWKRPGDEVVRIALERFNTVC
ncbi:MAG TPA: sugar phosphate isomerase/epimerase family protein [Devosia sp.]|nr:sugar phosphate isomerase/epimerase family protein [Devosia sp.]